MLVFPAHHRWRALQPQRRSDWAPHEDVRGVKTWWRAYAVTDDGKWVWRGFTQDREDFDVFIEALIRHLMFGEFFPAAKRRLVRGEVPDVTWEDGPNAGRVYSSHQCEWHAGIECRGYKFDQYWQLHAFNLDRPDGTQGMPPERAWRVPLDWNNGDGLQLPGLYQDDEWLFAPGTYLTTASSSPWTVISGWMNSQNKIETIGPGGSGGAVNRAPPVGAARGAGAGAYSSDANIPLVRGDTQPFAVGDGGALATATPGGTGTSGNSGTSDTAFGATTVPSPTCLVGAFKGTGGPAGPGSPPVPAAGGPTTGAKGTTTTSGGPGAGSPNPGGAGSGGGAGGPAHPGQAGQLAPTSGGAGDFPSPTGGPGGAPSPGSGATSTAGGTGTEMDASHGSGGGSGFTSTGTPPITTYTSGVGGNFGGASGGCAVFLSPTLAPPASTSKSGKAGPGLIAITNTLGGVWLPPSLTGVGAGGQFFQGLDAESGPGNAPIILNAPPGVQIARGQPHPGGVERARGRSFTGWPACLR